MNTRFEHESDLLAAMRNLPRRLTPGRDLWPGIAGQLVERKGAPVPSRHGTSRRQALAAMLVVAFAAGILLGRQLGTEPAAGPEGPTFNRALLAAMQATEKEYQAAFRQIIPVGTAPRAMLGSQAVENIENSWLELQQAESALLAALQEHPDNTYLNQRLLDLRAQQLGFMKQLATLDQFSRRKT